ncbi:hypothetical protein T02_10636 [Trichinella nativa]|uniref:Uncharacterized protein n=1 Tax=Trichinella nativa TaxID=6335 RepID=A0A0V1LSY9_9BILA|nr:hypothetical protein T02_10636 [Trichinella nativa]
MSSNEESTNYNWQLEIVSLMNTVNNVNVSVANSLDEVKCRLGMCSTFAFHRISDVGNYRAVGASSQRYNFKCLRFRRFCCSQFFSLDGFNGVAFIEDAKFKGNINQNVC